MVLNSDRLTFYLGACKMLKLKHERVLEMQYNPEIVRMMADAVEVCRDRIGFTGKEKLGDSFAISLNEEVMKRISEGALDTISKGQFWDCYMESLEQHRQYFKKIGKETKEMKQFYATLDEYQKNLNQRDPIVHYQGQTMRYSKFMILDRKPCFVAPIKGTDEKLAVDAAQLQEKLDAAKINVNVQDLEVRFNFPTKQVDRETDRKISMIMTLMEVQSKIDAEKLIEKKKKRNQFNRDRKKRNKKAQTGEAENASAGAHGEGPSTSTGA